MPHAIDRLLATPMIRPRLPRIRPEASAIRPPPLSRSPVRPLLWHRGIPPSRSWAGSSWLVLCDRRGIGGRFLVFVLMTCNEAECPLLVGEGAPRGWVPARRHGIGSGSAPLCARAYPGCRGGGRSGPGYARARTAL